MGHPSSTSSFPPPPPPLGNRQRRDSHISTAPTTVLPISIKKTKPSLRPSGVPAGANHERRFLSLLATPYFRIILYWNQMPISVSFFDWKMLRADKVAGQPQCIRPEQHLLREPILCTG